MSLPTQREEEEEEVPAVEEPVARPSDALGVFGTYLSIWVTAAAGLGVVIGHYAPAVPDALNRVTIAQISLPISIFIWLMVYPVLIQINLSALRRTRTNLRPLLITTGVNYLFQPFTMYGLARLFFEVVFRRVIDDRDLAREYVAGSVILGGSPCTAMVFVWSLLVGGDAAYTLVQVIINDLIIFVAYVPTLMLLLETTSISLPWDTAFVSVGLFLFVPGVAAVATRAYAHKYRSEAWLDRVVAIFKPVTMVALLCTLTLIFTFQAEQMVSRPVHVLLIGVPLLVQSYMVFGVAYTIMHHFRVPFAFAAPGALIATSNFFELAVAVALSLFGPDSGATLAAVVGVLEEVPVMLSLVWLCNHTRSWFPDPAHLDAYVAKRRAEHPMLDPLRRGILTDIAKQVVALGGCGVLVDKKRGGDECTDAKGVRLVFVCQHNSRRSQLAEAWCRELLARTNLRGVLVASAGAAATAVDKRTAAALRRAGFTVSRAWHLPWHNLNPRYNVSTSLMAGGVRGGVHYSKTAAEAVEQGADAPPVLAVTVCAGYSSSSDEACPMVPGSSRTIALPYDDPGAFNDTPAESSSYDNACSTIAREMTFLVDQVVVGLDQAPRGPSLAVIS